MPSPGRVPAVLTNQVSSMLLEASRLSLGYAGVPLLPSVSFQLDAGDVLAVIGHNGSGKSTHVKTLLGVIPPVSGAFQ